MALTLRSLICKSGSKLSLSPIYSDHTLWLRSHQYELFSCQTGLHLKPNISIRNYISCNKDLSFSNSTFYIHNTVFKQVEKIKLYRYSVNIPGSKYWHLRGNSIKLNKDHTRLASQLKPNVKPETDNNADFTEKRNSNYSPNNRPSPDQLNYVFNVLSKDLPGLFVSSFDYIIYHPQLIFENNIHNRRSVGLFNYIRQISLLRLWGHLRFAYVKLDVLKITQHPEDSTVKVRWTISGVSGLRVFLLFWKYRLWNTKDLFEKTTPWLDGFSTFHVDADGKIYKHVVDKMMPDMDREEIKSTRASPMDAAKLILIVGIIPEFSDMNSFF